MDKPYRPCPVPECHNLTKVKDGCDIHRPDPAHDQNYDKAWRAFAAGYLSSHRTCARCRRRPAREVHHLIPVKIAPHRRLDPTNIVGLCSPCHVTITAATRAVGQRKGTRR